MFSYLKNHKLKLLVLLLSLLGSSIAIADQTAIDYNNDKPTVEANRQAVINSANTFNPNASIPNYNPNPSETQYYQGVEQTHSDIDQKGAANLKNDKAGGTVYNDFKTRPQIKINPDAPEFDDSKLVKNDSYNITHGISDQYVDCQKHKTCHTETEEHQCKRSNSITLECTKTAIPRVKTVIVPAQDIPFSGTGHTDSRSEAYHAGASFTFPTTGILKSFSITAAGNWFGHFWIQIMPVHGRIDTRLYQQSISYSFSPLAIQVTAGEKGSFYADGREYASVPDVTIQYSGVIEIPAYEKQEGYVEWGATNCP